MSMYKLAEKICVKEILMCTVLNVQKSYLRAAAIALLLEGGGVIKFLHAGNLIQRGSKF